MDASIIFRFIYEFLRYLTIPALILLSLAGFKIYFNYKKYGKSVFRTKLEITVKKIDFILFYINKVAAYKKVKEIDGNVYVIMQSGIYFFKFFDYQGHLIGDFSDDQIQNRSNNFVRYIANPYKNLKFNQNYNINKYIIKYPTSVFDIKNIPGYKVIEPGDIFIELEKKSTDKYIYTIEQVDEIYEKGDLWL